MRLSRDVALEEDRRKRHVYVVGGSQSGKTTLLGNMFLWDVAEGHGCAFIDPNAEASDDLLARIPPSRVPDVVYFEPRDYPQTINPFLALGEYPDQLITSIVFIFQRLLSTYWGTQMDTILRHAVLSLARIPGATFLDIAPLLRSEEYRRSHMLRFSPEQQDYWTLSYDRLAPAAKQPLLDRLTPFTTSEMLTRVFAGVGPPLDIPGIVNGGKILIVKLRPSFRDLSDLMGAIVISLIQETAYGREDLPRPARRPFFLYVDEFQHLMGGPFDQMLTDAAKFGLHLTLAHQFVDQVDGKTMKAIRGNIGGSGTMIFMSVGPEDATHFGIPPVPVHHALVKRRKDAEERRNDNDHYGYVMFPTEPFPPVTDDRSGEIKARMAALAPALPPRRPPAPAAAGPPDDVPRSKRPGR